MDFKWLEDFVCLMDLGNFGAAAKARHVTQSAFSRRIQALELWVGVPLFDRTSYPITLTEPGKKFAPYVETLLSQVSVTKADFADVSLQKDNTVRIVSLHSFAVNLMPSFFQQGKADFDGLNIVMNTSIQGVDNHFQAILENTSDILLAYNMQAMRPSLLIEDKFDKLLVLKEDIIPVASPELLKSHPHNQPFPYLAYSEQTFLHNVVFPLVKERKQMLNQVYESTLTEAVIQMAVQGLGVAWAPRYAMRRELDEGLLVPAFPEQAALTVPLEIVCYRAKATSRASVDQFWLALQRVVAQEEAKQKAAASACLMSDAAPNVGVLI